SLHQLLALRAPHEEGRALEVRAQSEVQDAAARLEEDPRGAGPAAGEGPAPAGRRGSGRRARLKRAYAPGSACGRATDGEAGAGAGSAGVPSVTRLRPRW